MKIAIAAFAVVFCVACEQKPVDDEPDEPSTARQHANTNRAALKAAGKAAKQIENKGADRMKAADEAMNAGQ